MARNLNGRSERSFPVSMSGSAWVSVPEQETKPLLLTAGPIRARTRFRATRRRARHFYLARDEPRSASDSASRDANRPLPPTSHRVRAILLPLAISAGGIGNLAPRRRGRVSEKQESRRDLRAGRPMDRFL